MTLRYGGSMKKRQSKVDVVRPSDATIGRRHLTTELSDFNHRRTHESSQERHQVRIDTSSAYHCLKDDGTLERIGISFGRVDGAVLM